ncbi:hypothetical protein X474_06415 [Dethiosulfatarculus sandiegensis]|uniref:Uncharacterized protein n=1 Tax=Dethiosulfatarculus sandiegensis TaxID=1429043 RepID=A0A0D2GIY5_9BACT|nr:hypothetical protein X474_06415 [Dethiosulfatarculus sandiegensis]
MPVIGAYWETNDNTLKAFVFILTKCAFFFGANK